MKKFIEDFKAFALKGNIIAFIVLLTGKISISDLSVKLGETINEAGEVVPNLLTYGVFLQSIIDFIIIALSVFMVMRIAMKAKEKLEALKKKEEEAVEEAKEEEKETELSVLLEIRELLKDKE